MPSITKYLRNSFIQNLYSDQLVILKKHFKGLSPQKTILDIKKDFYSNKKQVILKHKNTWKIDFNFYKKGKIEVDELILLKFLLLRYAISFFLYNVFQTGKKLIYLNGKQKQLNTEISKHNSSKIYKALNELIYFNNPRFLLQKLVNNSE